jgi:hypothetical protein
MIIQELLERSQNSISAAAPEMDPLRDVDALREGQLLDFRVVALGSVAALLFELRTSLYFGEGNAGLLVIRGLQELRWYSAPARTPLIAFTVVTSSVSMGDAGLLKIENGFFPEARINIQGREAEFYVVEVPGIGEAPPDYSEGSFEGIKDSLPLWSSTCSLVQASRRSAS